MTKKHKKILIRIIISLVSVIILNLVQIPDILSFLLFFAVYILIGYDILKKAFHGIKSKRIFDENFLMAVATVGAFILSIIKKSGDYNEAVAVMIFYQTGELFQSVAVRKSRKNISGLMDIRPDYANLEIDGEIRKVNPFDVKKGDIITVNPGERIPLDGRVIFGSTNLDTSALTGESMPRFAQINDEVFSGTVNISGLIKIMVEKEFSESTASKILELVENASSRKSKSEKFISKFARIYTPLVCYFALFLALIPPIITGLLTNEWQWLLWIYRALTFLVISCPCALVISIPLAFFAGIGGMSKEGILVKGSNFLEILSKVKCVVFDKTGTLTQGVFQVTGIIGENKEKNS